jgi:hypothetical protein
MSLLVPVPAPTLIRTATFRSVVLLELGEVPLASQVRLFLPAL